MHWREQNELAAGALAHAKITIRGKLRVNCPLCQYRTGKQDKKTSLSGNINSGRFYCYKCGASGRFSEQAYDPNAVKDNEEIKLFDPPEGYTPLWKEPFASAFCTEHARRYLRSRHCFDSMWEPLQIGCCLSGFYAGSVVVPVLLPDRAWAGYVCRAYVPTSNPYLYPADMSKGLVLFNGEALWVETETPLLVVEGVFDTTPYWPDAVALLGKASGEQRNLLALARRPVCVVQDGDAWQEGWSLALWLRMQGQRAGHIRLPPKKDPDEMNPSWLREAAIQSINEPL